MSNILQTKLLSAARAGAFTCLSMGGVACSAAPPDESYRCTFRTDSTIGSVSLFTQEGKVNRITAETLVRRSKADTRPTPSCTVEIVRGNKDFRWVENADRSTTVEVVAAPAEDPEDVEVRETKAGYEIAFNIAPSRFCGQSTPTVRQVALDKKKQICTLLKLND
jgi:hypothetical protein